jgi:hypothetical protein
MSKFIAREVLDEDKVKWSNAPNAPLLKPNAF